MKKIPLMKPKLILDYCGLHTVVSGGQTGADQAGLHAARHFNIKTGGYIPKGFRTQAGSMPSLGTKYNLIEHSSSSYPPRTKLNAQMGDVTVRLASNFNSPGERLTIKLCNELKKPVLDIHLHNDVDYDGTALLLVNFLITHAAGCLNVAGNSDRGELNGYHFRQARVILIKAFKILDDQKLIIKS
jgi:hypothetical protein